MTGGVLILADPNAQRHVKCTLHALTRSLQIVDVYRNPEVVGQRDNFGPPSPRPNLAHLCAVDFGCHVVMARNLLRVVIEG